MPWKSDQSRVHRSFHSMQNSRSAWLKRQKQGANCGSFTERTRGNRRDTVGVNIWSALNRAAQWGADTHTWLQCITYSCPCFTKCFHLYLFDTPLKAFTLLLTLYSISHESLLRLKGALLHFSKWNASTHSAAVFWFVSLLLHPPPSSSFVLFRKWAPDSGKLGLG